jgi:hypothetical protein
MFAELFWNAIHSTPQGYLGVSLIYAYMALIVGTAFYRIYQNSKHPHH